jgi:aryl-alcohol dehydrogenase-like predicted oxidoreductase
MMRRIAEQRDAGVDQIALAAALAQPWADVVLSGAATVEALASNVGATQVSLNPQDLADVLSVAERPVDYWRSRSSRPWN